MKAIYLWLILSVATVASAVNLLPFQASLRVQQEPKHDAKDWWETTVFYQIYPRSFKDSDGDGIGDLKGITAMLPHLKDAGIGATWLSPVFKSPMVDFGYDVSDFLEIDEIFGTMEDFDNLLFQAKQLGIKVILDFVPNHSSDQHRWFNSSIYREEDYEDYYVWRDGIRNEETGAYLPPNNWVSVFMGPAWTWNNERQQFYLHQFTKEQPDLNFRNPKVIEEMTNVLKFWLDKGVDGFRVDAINHMFENPDFLDDNPIIEDYDPNNYEHFDHIHTKNLPESYQVVYNWRQMFDDYTAEHGSDTKILMTEAYANIEQTMLWYQSADGTQKGGHIPFNFLLIMDLNNASKAQDFKTAIDTWINNMPDGHNANWVLGNHDRPRVGSRYGTNLIDAMNTLVMTLPGIGVTYYGEEIGMLDNRLISWNDTQDPQACNTDEERYQLYTRDPVRTPFQWDSSVSAGFSTNSVTWLPVHPDYETNNLKLQVEAEGKSHYKIYQSLVQLRDHHTLTYGDFKSEAINDNVFAYIRSDEHTENVIVAINLSNDEQIVDLSNLGKLQATGDIRISSSVSNYNEHDTVQINDVKLSPYDAIVFVAETSAAAGIKLSLITLLLVAFRYFFL